MKCVSYEQVDEMLTQVKSYIDSVASGGTAKDDFFATNDDGYLVLSDSPTTSNTFEVDSNGYITIKES